MIEYARSTIIPNGVIKLWLATEFVCTHKHRAKKSLYFLLFGLYRIHIDIIFSIMCSEFDDIFLTRDYILDFVLVEDSVESTKGLSSLLTYLSWDSDMLSSWESKCQHRMRWSIPIWKRSNNIIHSLYFSEIKWSIIVSRFKIGISNPLMVSDIFDSHCISRPRNNRQYRICFLPVSIEWWFLAEPPSKTNSKNNEYNYKQ